MSNRTATTAFQLLLGLVVAISSVLYALDLMGGGNLVLIIIAAIFWLLLIKED